jgi:hypothetical protein
MTILQRENPIMTFAYYVQAELETPNGFWNEITL